MGLTLQRLLRVLFGGASGKMLQMHQLTVFLSSTVDDLGSVRDEVATALRRFGINVLRSETNDFPVKAGVSSHEACLEAARNADVLVTLIATRYGGSSSSDGRSITWCEYDAAIAASVYPIVLIRKDVSDLAKRIHEERTKLAKKKSKPKESEADAKLRGLFPDVKPYVQNLPAQQRFIAAVRKGHVNNWVEMAWSGTTEAAVNYIMSKLASLLVSLAGEAEKNAEQSDALRQLLEWSAILHNEVRAGKRTSDQAVDRILELCVEHRRALFGFGVGDRFNFMLFLRDGDVLRPKARRTDVRIAMRNRTWKVGEGHAGKAILMGVPLVTPYLPDSDMWTKSEAIQDKSDRENYASAVSVPFADSSGNVNQVFIVTSSRKDHFHDDTQPEALTCASLGRILGLLSRLEEA